MEIEFSKIDILMFISWFIGGIAILVFCLRNREDDFDYMKYIHMMEEQTNDNLNTLKDGNKKIDNIEKKILQCKKKLGWKLFNK